MNELETLEMLFETEWIVQPPVDEFEEGIQPANKWAAEQWSEVDLGDVRLNRRAVQVGGAMAKHPSGSLPRQMQDAAALRAAYGLLNHNRITLEKLSEPHWNKTRREGEQHDVVLFVQDTTQVDYTHHATKKGLGPIGDGKGRGLLLHTTLAVTPGEAPQVLGVAHQKAVLRRPPQRPRPKHTRSPEGLVWTDAVKSVGKPPRGVRWVHVGDGKSDDFRFMHACRRRGKDFLVRGTHNRILEWNSKQVTPRNRKIRDFMRGLSAKYQYVTTLPARPKRPARTVELALTWAKVTIPAPAQGPSELRGLPSIEAWSLRIWEIDPPREEDAVEWFLLTSVPTKTVDEAMTRVRWYLLRWLTEDYHKCLKTGCSLEKRRLDEGDDIRRLLGFLGPIAAKLLQMRNLARAEPDAPAEEHVDELTLGMLNERLEWPPDKEITLRTFWHGVAQLGGYLGRRGDGPPGWQTIWKGWRELQQLVDGARLFARMIKLDADST
jgi:hypothetical protein